MRDRIEFAPAREAFQSGSLMGNLAVIRVQLTRRTTIHRER